MDSDGIYGLIDSYLDGGLDEAGLCRLREWLKADHANVHTFVRRMMTHDQLRQAMLIDNSVESLRAATQISELPAAVVPGSTDDLAHGVLPPQVLPQQLSAADDSTPLSFANALAARLFRLGGLVRMPRAAAALVIAMTCCGAVLATAVTVAMLKPQLHLPPKYVAQLTAAHELQWAGADESPMIDQLLTEGQTLEIVAGWAEITFKGGARTVLEGPAVMELRSGDSAKLTAGKLAVELSRHPQGFVVNTTKFSVDTPTSRVVDSGAEFGVQVDAGKSTQIDVFEGLVNIHPLGNEGTQLVGPPEWLSAGESLRVSPSIEPNAGQPVIERLPTSEIRFVRTVRAKSFTIGSECIGRAVRDQAAGTVSIVRVPTRHTGRAASFSFYNVHAENDHWITPIIFAFDQSTETYRITGIGQSVLNMGSGNQTVPFLLVAGSNELQADVHTFGFFQGMVDKTGKTTLASRGPIEFDHVPEVPETGGSKLLSHEARWLYVPDTKTPVQLRLGMEFSMSPTADQIVLSPPPDEVAGCSRERVYSGLLEIVREPEFSPNGHSRPGHEGTRRVEPNTFGNRDRQ